MNVLLNLICVSVFLVVDCVVVCLLFDYVLM